MKTILQLKIIVSCMSLITLASCESQEQKADNAFESVKEEKMLSRVISSITPELATIPKKIEVIKNVERLDDWAKFKLAIENKIQANEKRISVTKKQANATSKQRKKLIRLEETNKELRKLIIEYQEEWKTKMEKFKEKINIDANEISVELKDMVFVENK